MPGSSSTWAWSRGAARCAADHPWGACGLQRPPRVRCFARHGSGDPTGPAAAAVSVSVPAKKQTTASGAISSAGPSAVTNEPSGSNRVTRAVSVRYRHGRDWPSTAMPSAITVRDVASSTPESRPRTTTDTSPVSSFTRRSAVQSMLTGAMTRASIDTPPSSLYSWWCCMPGACEASKSSFENSACTSTANVVPGAASGPLPGTFSTGTARCSPPASSTPG
jgi:hypothetical protein